MTICSRSWLEVSSGCSEHSGFSFKHARQQLYATIAKKLSVYAIRYERIAESSVWFGSFTYTLCSQAVRKSVCVYRPPIYTCIDVASMSIAAFYPFSSFHSTRIIDDEDDNQRTIRHLLNCQLPFRDRPSKGLQATRCVTVTKRTKTKPSTMCYERSSPRTIAYSYSHIRNKKSSSQLRNVFLVSVSWFALLVCVCPPAAAALSADLCFLSHGGSSETFTVNEAIPVNSVIGTLKVSNATRRSYRLFLFNYA